MDRQTRRAAKRHRAETSALVAARNAHRERHQGHDVQEYGNFVECHSCGKHAHLLEGWTDTPTLVLHGPSTDQEFIKPEEF
jgi:hypothetical protein